VLKIEVLKCELLTMMSNSDLTCWCRNLWL